MYLRNNDKIVPRLMAALISLYSLNSLKKNVGWELHRIAKFCIFVLVIQNRAFRYEE